MTSTDGFPVLGAEISIQGKNVYVDSEKLTLPQGVGNVHDTHWRDDVLEVIFEGDKHYYYVSHTRFFTASEKMKLNEARKKAGKYRDQLTTSSKQSYSAPQKEDDWDIWSVLWKIISFPFKVIWKILVFLRG